MSMAQAPGGPQMDPSVNQPLNVQRDLHTRLFDLINTHEIGPRFRDKLFLADGREFKIIVDNSGSMNTVLEAGHAKTRWNELEERATMIAEITTIFDPDGIDLYTLNGINPQNGEATSDLRKRYRNVKDSEGIKKVFRENRPGGFTNIPKVLFDVYREMVVDKQYVIILATDGSSTDDNGYENPAEFERALRLMPANATMTIMACTSDDKLMEYLNGLDNSVRGLDVVDDYDSEKKEILKAQGPEFRFSRGDYIVKTLVGSFDPEMDRLDQRSNGSEGRLDQPVVKAQPAPVYHPPAYRPPTPPPSYQPPSLPSPRQKSGKKKKDKKEKGDCCVM